MNQLEAAQQVILVTTNMPDVQSAQELARKLVECRLAACVNYFPGVQSVYRWQGAIEEASEVGLAIKSTQAQYPALEAAIKTMHPYDLPEIIAMPVVIGSPKYLDWVVQETGSKEKDDSDG
ncbi:divalent-cation tolerance protein CutA [soil metagenome]